MSSITVNGVRAGGFQHREYIPETDRNGRRIVEKFDEDLNGYYFVYADDESVVVPSENIPDERELTDPGWAIFIRERDKRAEIEARIGLRYGGLGE